MVSSEIKNLTSMMQGANMADGVVSFAGKAIKMDKGEDAKDIIEAVENSKNLKVLVLEGNTMGVKAAELIGEALGKHKEFERAKWSDMFTGRLKTEIPPALKSLGAGIIASSANLVELDLSDNAFGPIGVEGIADLLRSASCYGLQELRLNNNGLGPNGGKMLAAVLEDTYKSSSEAGKPLALKVFVSGRGRLENEGAKALSEVFKKMGSLEFVSMPQNGINPPGITALAQAFSHNKKLKHINLCDNTFTVSGAVAMAEALPQLTELEVLNLESCLIRTGGAKAIARALDGEYPKLKEVNCNYNEITRRGAVALVENVALLPSVEILQLDGNSLGEEGKDVVRATLEAVQKSDLVPSLEEDEGTDDEEEEESGDEVEADSIPVQNTSPQQYIESPSEPALRGLSESEWFEYISKELSSLDDEIDLSDRLVYLCMKLAVPLTLNTVTDLKNKACRLCDKAFEAVENRKPSPSVLCNSILVNLGLLKSENKKFRPASENLTGPLVLLDHLVRQDYYPQHTAQTLHFYLTQSEKKLEKFFQAKHQLMQTLFAL